MKKNICVVIGEMLKDVGGNSSSIGPSEVSLKGPLIVRLLV